MRETPRNTQYVMLSGLALSGFAGGTVSANSPETSGTGRIHHVLVKISRRFGNVFGRVVQAEPRRQGVTPALGEYLAMPIVVKLVDHHAVKARQCVDIVGDHIAEQNKDLNEAN
ncbi:MAG: hypothetical protein JWR40_5181 [Massilia sp.]|jgi:hypothetical protein|nr:hypothetical protein [Massilia sp.]MDB5951231.1 hypothetical protein [Massilia sp.]